MPTIRAYRDQPRFISSNDFLMNLNNRPYFLQLSAQRWLALRLELIGSLLVFFAAIFSVISVRIAWPFI